jgi:hypothetical protein
MVLDGLGDQQFLTKKYNDDRNKALYDRTKFTNAELTNLELNSLQGDGKRDPDSYTIEQFPYPMDPSIRRKKDIDIRVVDPSIGEQSD